MATTTKKTVIKETDEPAPQPEPTPEPAPKSPTPAEALAEMAKLLLPKA